MKLIITDTDIHPLPKDSDYEIIKPQGTVIHPCTGCFGCWVRTPGKCVIHDGYENTGIAMGKCTELILISRCCYGSVSPFVKAVQDRAISYIHPDFVIRKGEMYHKRRYPNVISLSAYFYGEHITEAEIIQAEPALKVLENWCVKAGFLWSGGIGIGGGGALAQMPHVKNGHGPKAPVAKALRALADSILQNEAQKNHYVSIAFPRFLYKLAAQMGWQQMVKQNGGRARDLGKRWE